MTTNEGHIALARPNSFLGTSSGFWPGLTIAATFLSLNSSCEAILRAGSYVPPVEAKPSSHIIYLEILAGARPSLTSVSPTLTIAVIMQISQTKASSTLLSEVGPYIIATVTLGALLIASKRRFKQLNCASVVEPPLLTNKVSLIKPMPLQKYLPWAAIAIHVMLGSERAVSRCRCYWKEHALMLSDWVLPISVGNRYCVDSCYQDRVKGIPRHYK